MHQNDEKVPIFFPNHSCNDQIISVKIAATRFLTAATSVAGRGDSVLG